MKNALSQEPVDYLIHTHFFDELRKTDWSLLITHNNGLDQRVHLNGLASETVNHVLIENDNKIEYAINSFVEKKSQVPQNLDFLLLTFGDHGLSKEGTHGGGSEEELNAGLFAYSTAPFTIREIILQSMEIIRSIERVANVSLDLKFFDRALFKQIDLPPTISYFYNTPIPFSNVGTIIPELLLYPKMHYNAENATLAETFVLLVIDQIINYLQVMHYVTVFNKECGEAKTQKKLLKGYWKTKEMEIKEFFDTAKEMTDLELSQKRHNGTSWVS